MFLDLPEGQRKYYPATLAGAKPCAKPGRPDVVCVSRTTLSSVEGEGAAIEYNRIQTHIYRTDHFTPTNLEKNLIF